MISRPASRAMCAEPVRAGSSQWSGLRRRTPEAHGGSNLRGNLLRKLAIRVDAQCIVHGRKGQPERHKGSCLENLAFAQSGFSQRVDVCRGSRVRVGNDLSGRNRMRLTRAPSILPQSFGAAFCEDPTTEAKPGHRHTLRRYGAGTRAAASGDVMTGTTSNSTRSSHARIHSSRSARSAHCITW